MRRISIVLLALGLAGCATDVFGPYKGSISPGDMKELKALIATRPDIHKGYLRISATRPKCVYVQTATTLFDEITVSFVACKRDGKWHIKEGSVREQSNATVVSIAIPVTSYPH